MSSTSNLASFTAMGLIDTEGLSQVFIVLSNKLFKALTVPAPIGTTAEPVLLFSFRFTDALPPDFLTRFINA